MIWRGFRIKSSPLRSNAIIEKMAIVLDIFGDNRRSKKYMKNTPARFINKMLTEKRVRAYNLLGPILPSISKINPLSKRRKLAVK